MVEADLRGWLPVMGVVLPEEQIQRILEEAEQGAMAFDLPAHIVTGVKRQAPWREGRLPPGGGCYGSRETGYRGRTCP